MGYIVLKVSFTDNSTNEALNISVTVNYKNNQISFTMPDRDVSVFADIVDVVTYESNEWNFCVGMGSFKPFSWVYYYKDENKIPENYKGKCKKVNGTWYYILTDVEDKSIVGEPTKDGIYAFYLNGIASVYDSNLRVVSKDDLEGLPWAYKN